MAVTKTTQSVSLIISVEDTLNSKGEMTYKKKSFSNVNLNASAENIHNVATAISNVLSKATGDYTLKETSLLLNE